MCLLNILANFPKQAAREEWKLFFWGRSRAEKSVRSWIFSIPDRSFFSPPTNLCDDDDEYKYIRATEDDEDCRVRRSWVREWVKSARRRAHIKKSVWWGKKTSSCEIYTIAIAVRRERHLHTSSALWKMYVYMENTKKSCENVVCCARSARRAKTREVNFVWTVAKKPLQRNATLMQRRRIFFLTLRRPQVSLAKSV